MGCRVFAASACLVLATAGAAPGRIADRDIEFVISNNEATREQLSSVRYQFQEGAFLYQTPRDTPLIPLAAIPDRTSVFLRHGTVLARGDYRAWEIDALMPGGDGVDELHTRSFAIRNDRYFALSHGVIVGGTFSGAGKVSVYPHGSADGSTLGSTLPGRHEQHRYTADVLDYAFLSDRLGRTLRSEVEHYLLSEADGSVEMEILRDLDGAVREYRLHLSGVGVGAAAPSLVSYALDPRAGFLIIRKETFDGAGNLLAQRRINSMPLGETGLHFPAEVIEVTFTSEDGPDGPLPMPRTETRIVASDVEMLRVRDAGDAFGLSAFGLEDDSEVLVFDGARDGYPTNMSAETAEQRIAEMSTERRPSRATNPRTGDHRRTPAPLAAPRPSAGGGFLSRTWEFIAGLFGGLGALTR